MPGLFCARNEGLNLKLASDAELRRVLRFAEPTVLEDGVKLTMLREAIAYSQGVASDWVVHGHPSLSFAKHCSPPPERSSECLRAGDANLLPLLTAAAAIIVLGEPVRPFQFIGGGLAFARQAAVSPAAVDIAELLARGLFSGGQIGRNIAIFDCYLRTPAGLLARGHYAAQAVR